MCQTESLRKQLKEWQELADDFDKLQREQGTLPDFSHHTGCQCIESRNLGTDETRAILEDTGGNV